MLKKIIILGLWLLVLMCCLIACDGSDNLKGIEITPVESIPLELSSEKTDEKDAKTSYSVTMTNKEWLYEDLKSSYKVGEEVVVKIGIATDTGYFLVVNGEKVEEDAWQSDRDWWQFTFTMPQDDVIIEFKTYDGFLQYPNEALLIEAYWLANPEADSVRVKHYYGEYESGAVVAMMEAGDYTQAAWMESIELYDIWYNDGNRILVLFEGDFYTLTEAYENKYLTKEDIVDIRAKQMALYGHLGAQDE